MPVSNVCTACASSTNGCNTGCTSYGYNSGTSSCVLCDASNKYQVYFIY